MNNDRHIYNSADRLERIKEEFEKGFHFLEGFNKSVTIFGSARLPADSPYYEKASKLAEKLGESGFTVITGGGPGIMEAANKGATEVGGRSVGLNIQLPKEQRANQYVKEGIPFYYFFTRKVMLAFSSQAYVFFPGGYGTLDEFYEIVTLIQTGKIRDHVPVILIGKDFWGTLCEWMREVLRERYSTISPGDLDIWTLTDDIEEAFELVKKSPTRDEF